jgi:hypothetical protein
MKKRDSNIYNVNVGEGKTDIKRERERETNKERERESNSLLIILFLGKNTKMSLPPFLSLSLFFLPYLSHFLYFK